MAGPVGELNTQRELAGFLLPGLVHEFKNLLSRINLLTEMPQERSPLAHIRQETYSPEFVFLCELMGCFSSAPEKPAASRSAPSKDSEISIPNDFEPVFRVLRSAARAAGNRLRIEDMPATTMLGDRIDVAVRLCREVYKVFYENASPCELSLAVAKDAETGAQAFLLTFGRGAAATVPIGGL